MSKRFPLSVFCSEGCPGCNTPGLAKSSGKPKPWRGRRPYLTELHIYSASVVQDGHRNFALLHQYLTSSHLVSWGGRQGTQHVLCKPLLVIRIQVSARQTHTVQPCSATQGHLNRTKALSGSVYIALWPGQCSTERGEGIRSLYRSASDQLEGQSCSSPSLPPWINFCILRRFQLSQGVHRGQHTHQTPASLSVNCQTLGWAATGTWGGHEGSLVSKCNGYFSFHHSEWWAYVGRYLGSCVASSAQTA